MWFQFVFVWDQPPDEGLPALQEGPVDTGRDATFRHGDFPRFLGPHGDATVHDAYLDPDWAAHPPHEVWRRKLGAGWSSFAVAGELVFTQEQRGATS